MTFEKSCGALVIHFDEKDEAQILMIKHVRGGHRSFPKGHVEAGESERALKYIEELDYGVMNTDTLLKTGNVSVDVILSAKIAKAKSKGINVTVKANLPDNLNITDVELSIVIGNLLDNAIEACTASTDKEPFIRVYLVMKSNMLYFSMLNSSGDKLKKDGSLFNSKKGGFHGFGLRRAESIIEKHGGWIKYNSEDGAFSSEFLVPAID